MEQTAITRTLEFWESEWHKLVVTNEAGTETAEKTVVTDVESDRLISTVFFGSQEANFHIKRVRLYDASDVLLSVKSVSINKSDKQSLTLVRRDILKT